MPRQETVDFMTAFAIGAVLGVGATLLLRDGSDEIEKLIREVVPVRKRARKQIRKARRGLSRKLRSATEAGESVAGAGADALDEVRSEVSDIVRAARREIARAARRGLRGTRSSILDAAPWR